MFKTYLINDETTAYIAILNGEGNYILDLFDDVVYNGGYVDSSDYDTEDYYQAVLKSAIERDEFDADMCWTNRAGCITEIGEAEDIEEVLEKEWWSKGYRASYEEIAAKTDVVYRLIDLDSKHEDEHGNAYETKEEALKAYERAVTAHRVQGDEDSIIELAVYEYGRADGEGLADVDYSDANRGECIINYFEEG